MDDESDPGASFVWDVRPDLIDYDRWARSTVSLAVKRDQAQMPTFVRYGLLAIIVLGIVVIGAVWSVGTALPLVLLAVVMFAGVKLLARRAATKLAKLMRNLPSASEPYTFRADSSGTHGHGESWSETFTWARYKSIVIDDDQVVLTLDSDAIRLLPVRGLTSGQSASTAIDRITDWIESTKIVAPSSEGSRS